MSAHREALDAVRGRLRELLAALDASGSAAALAQHPAQASGALDAALAACRRDFDALRALGPREASGHATGDADTWAADLEAVLRLNAVCVGRVEAESETLLQALVDARAQKRRLSGLRPAVEPGGSCDVAC